MWLSPIKFVSSKIYFRNVSLIRFFSVSTVPQLETTHIDDSELTSFASIELNSVEVVQIFSDLRNDPNRALSFFDQLKDGRFTHNVNTYAAIVRILCYSRLDRKLGSVLLELIEKETDLDFEMMELFQVVVDGIEIENERYRVATTLCDSLVKAFVNDGKFHEALDVLFETNSRGYAPCILSCNFLLNRLVECGNVDMAVAIFMQLKNIGLSPNEYTYSIAVKAFCVNGNFEEALDVLEQMEKNGVTHNKYAYKTFIHGLCRHGKSDLGFELLQEWMESKGLISVYAYAVVIQGFCNEMQLDKAEEAFIDMQNKGLFPDVYAYGALICALCRAGNLRKAMDFHDEMTSRGIETNSVIVCSILQRLSQICMAPEVVYAFEKYERMGISLGKTCCNVVMDAFCKVGEVEKAAGILDKMKERRICPDIVSYTILINGYFLKGEVDKAKDLVKEMQDNGHVPDAIFYNVLVRGMSRNGYEEKAVMKVFDVMRSQDIEPNTVMHKMIIEGLCIAGKVKQARAFFYEHECVENYSSLVRGHCLAKHTDEAFQLFMNRSEYGDIMDRGCYWELLNNLVTEGKYEKALHVLEIMLALSINPSDFMMGKLIGMLCESGELLIARKAFHWLIEKGLTPTMVTYTIMINEYCRRNWLREAFDLLSDMKKKGIKPDVITYSIFLSHCSIPDTMNLLSEMMEMGIELDVIGYTILIDKNCKRENVDVAEILFNDMIERGLEPDVVTYTVLLEGLFRAGENDKACVHLDEILSKGIPVDERFRTILIKWGLRLHH